jgi:hypothetical protein
MAFVRFTLCKDRKRRQKRQDRKKLSEKRKPDRVAGKNGSHGSIFREATTIQVPVHRGTLMGGKMLAKC